MLDLISLIMFAFSGKLSSPNDVTVLLKLLLTYWTRVPWLPDLSVGQIQVEQCLPCGAVLENNISLLLFQKGGGWSILLFILDIIIL